MRATAKALWHRHWIDSWGGLLVATVVTIALCIVFLTSIAFDAADEGSEPSSWLEPIMPLSVLTSARELAAWSAHTFTTALASFGLIIFIHGTGIRSNDLRPGHPSIYFNLTLPVSRTLLVVTRFLTSALWALALIGSLFLSNAAVLLVANYPVPAAEMAQTSLIGFLFLVTAVWILDLTALVNETLSFWLTLSAAAVVAIGWSNVMGFIAGQPFTLNKLLVFVAVAALALASAIVAAHRRDF